MATGCIAWTCLLLAAGLPGGEDVTYLNSRGFQIPISVRPGSLNDINELILYVSRDQGKTWGISARAAPTEKGFEYFSDSDGMLYFNVASVDRRGRQDPPDIYKVPPGQKIYVDTVKPIVRLLSAERLGDEVQVSWEIREDNPDWSSLRLEYRAGESAGAPWVPLPIERSQRGNLKFRPGVAGEVTIRLFLRDLAGNEATEERPVPGAPPLRDNLLTRAGAEVPPPPSGLPVPPPMPGPSMVRELPPVGTAVPPSQSLVRPVSEQTPISYSAGASAANTPITAPAMGRGALPSLQIVNRPQVKLGFDVARFGPSGLGTVDVYVTTDEGNTWQKATSDPAINLPVSPETRGNASLHGTVTVQLPKEGTIFGYYLVVKSRAGLGKSPPRPGDIPQVRLELDKTPPVAVLNAPQPAPGRQDALIMSWRAEDRNLAANPISLEWAPSANGPWEFIGDAQLPNTGRYTWQVPDRIPPKVYLKLTARDVAGNTAVAVTPDPVVIDVVIPEISEVRPIITP
jgi:hypothetical protein